MMGRGTSSEPCPFCGLTIDRHSTLDMSCPPVAGRTPSPDEERVFDELVASGQEQSGRSTSRSTGGDMHFPTVAVCANCGGGPCRYSALDALSLILDNAYTEWAGAGFPAGEGVVHLWQFQRAGLWKPPTAHGFWPDAPEET